MQIKHLHTLSIKIYQDKTMSPRTTTRDTNCWTHGACFHPGQKCCNEALGHQDNATFQNCMGGSIKNVRGIQQQPDPSSTQNT